MRLKRLWMIQLAMLAALVLWLAMDPWVEAILPLNSLSQVTERAGWLRVSGLAVLIFVAAISLFVLVLKWLGRSGEHAQWRSLRQMLAITSVIACWCALGIHHEAIAWQGKRIRFAWRIEPLEAIVAPLRAEWPQQDGELSSIGPFMAYPFGEPTTLVLLHAPQLSSHRVHISAIERGRSGAIRLQLTGADGGDWAEWHPPSTRPRSFVGGLADAHELQSATPIGDGWFLVRYQTSHGSLNR